MNENRRIALEFASRLGIGNVHDLIHCALKIEEFIERGDRKIEQKARP